MFLEETIGNANLAGSRHGVYFISGAVYERNFESHREKGQVNHCSKFVVVIGSERRKSSTNGSTLDRCICLKNIIESKIFRTDQKSNLFYESDALTS
jgi:hypothetical protein